MEPVGGLFGAQGGQHFIEIVGLTFVLGVGGNALVAVELLVVEIYDFFAQWAFQGGVIAKAGHSAVFLGAIAVVAVFGLFWALDGEISVTKHSSMMSMLCIVLDLIIII